MKEHEYFVYIVFSNSGALYIGMTNTIYRRALHHKRGESEGFAAKYRCTREKQLKGWVRREKIALMEYKNPR